MKYVVLTIVGVWSAFLTLVQSFQAWERLLVVNSFSAASMTLVAVSTALIGFGYTRLFIALIDKPIPRMRTLTYCLVCGIFVALIFVLRPFNFMEVYTQADMYVREHHHTVLTWMDYGNMQLLVGTILWWTLIGFVLTFVSVRKKK